MSRRSRINITDVEALIRIEQIRMSINNKFESALFEVKLNGYAILHLPHHLKTNIEIVCAAVTQNGYVLGSILEMNTNKQVVITAVKSKGGAICYASEELKKDKEVIYHALDNDGAALQYLDDAYKDNSNYVIRAILNNGFALYYASDRLKDNDYLVKMAVQHNGSVYRYISYRLKNDIEIVLLSLEKDYVVYSMLSENLRNNYTVLVATIASNKNAIKNLRLRINDEFYKSIVEKIAEYNKFMIFMMGSVDLPTKIPNSKSLVKLNEHGKYHARVLKQSIREFYGVITRKEYLRLVKAEYNIRYHRTNKT